MNVYFLVEGKRTEPRVYPEWLKHLVPGLVRVTSCDKVVKNHFYLFSGEGYPSLITNHLSNAIADVNRHGNFDYLVLCLDVDDSTPKDLEQFIHKHLEKNDAKLLNFTQLVIIYQNKCFETWFLGHRKIFKRNPSNPKLREHIKHYNVCENDPEEMPIPSEFNGSIANFHCDYFKRMCLERNRSYSKKQPGLVTDNAFLNELIARFQETSHISSFGLFFQFCERIKLQII